jgi:hypothetical protein
MPTTITLDPTFSTISAQSRRTASERQSRLSTQLRRSPIAPARSFLGHEDLFPPIRLNARHPFS